MTDKRTKECVESWRWRIAKAGMTQRDFAEYEAGVTATNLGQYILKKKTPRPITVEKIEAALKRLGV